MGRRRVSLAAVDPAADEQRPMADCYRRVSHGAADPSATASRHPRGADAVRSRECWPAADEHPAMAVAAPPSHTELQFTAAAATSCAAQSIPAGTAASKSAVSVVAICRTRLRRPELHQRAWLLTAGCVPFTPEIFPATALKNTGYRPLRGTKTLGDRALGEALFG